MAQMKRRHALLDGDKTYPMNIRVPQHMFDALCQLWPEKNISMGTKSTTAVLFALSSAPLRAAAVAALHAMPTPGVKQSTKGEDVLEAAMLKHGITSVSTSEIIAAVEGFVCDFGRRAQR